MGIFGEDWASYQGASPDLSGVSFAFVKITEGLTYVNPYWPEQRARVKGANLPWGAYHYPNMHNDPTTEADHFLAQVLWMPGDMIVLDWEGYDPANAGVSPAQMVAYKDAWLRHVQERMPGHRVGLYCNTDYWTHVDTTSFCGDFLWIATSGLPAGQPGIQHPWVFHQFGQHSTSAGMVDQDYGAFDSVQQLHDWALALTVPTPAPTPHQLTPSEVDMTPFHIDADVTVDVPVEPAGTTTAPQGGARNAGIWLCLTPQGADTDVQITLHRSTTGHWDPADIVHATVDGPKAVVTLPTDGSVDKVRVRSGAPLLAYVTGRQVA